METRGWANIVPPAIRATASTPNVVFILYFLLPLLECIPRTNRQVTQNAGFRRIRGAGWWWRRTAAVVFSRSSHGRQALVPGPATPAAVGGFSGKDGVF